MSSLNIDGLYDLTTKQIDEVVTIKSASNYALLNVRNNEFCDCYVGRSDNDINGRLKQWADEKPKRYTHFIFSYATSPKAAFEEECRNYHDFVESNKLDNENHPDRPDGTNWKCPKCGIFN